VNRGSFQIPLWSRDAMASACALPALPTAAGPRKAGPGPNAGMARVEVKVNGVRSAFRVPSNMALIKGIGAGTYGMVGAFKDTSSGKKCAIKKITNAFEDLIDGKRILREVRLLRSLKHENIVSILDMYAPEGPDFDDVYIVQELLEMDLNRVIRSKEPLAEEHHRWFAYQILKGVNYMHGMDVVHRDLKPSNILVNRDCTLKICDFGLARGSVHSKSGASATLDSTSRQLTEYVVTRHYRAPEVVLTASEYGKAIDIWSVGCIFGELINRKALFKGKDHLDQIQQILQVVGAPALRDVAWLKDHPTAAKYVLRFRDLPGRSWTSVFPDSSPETARAIGEMLRFDPTKRPCASECMQLAAFSELFRENDLKPDSEPIDWSFDRFEPTKRLLQNYLYAECAAYDPSIVERDGLESLSARGITKEVLGRGNRTRSSSPSFSTCSTCSTNTSL